MTSYWIRRCLAMIPVLIGVSLLVFLMIHLIPGDPAHQIAGRDATGEQLRMIRAELGLDRPLHIQYLSFVGNLLRGDMGRSLVTRSPVSHELTRRLPYTIILAVSSVVVAGLGGIVLGVLSAVKQYSLFDHASMSFALLGVSMPTFWIAIMLIWVFAVNLQLLPAGGLPDNIYSLSAIRWLILPVVTLAWTIVGMVTRLTRSTMLEVVRQDYVRTARAKGLSERVVVFRHALRNAMLPVVTYLGLQFGFLLGGAVVTESVFAWPGLGRYLLQGIYDRDYPVIQSSILVMAFAFVAINTLVDLCYGLLDPRISYN